MTTLLQVPGIDDTEKAVRAQARVRAIVGVPVVLAGLLGLLLYEKVPLGMVGPVALIQVLYIATLLFLAGRLQHFSAKTIAFATAILDPLILSAWLPMAGEVGGLAVGFYLFTILGYGFRTGPRLMLVCQIASIVGFSDVMLFDSYWRQHEMVWFSFLVTLILVPIYATVLIKKLHEARAHAERESQAKSELLAKVSHELRTPLSGIVAAAQLLAAETEDSRVIARAETITGLSKDLLREINDLLDQAKYEAHALVLESTLFELRDQMERLRMVLEPAAVKKNLAFVVYVDPRIEDRVQGDSHYLTKVLMNLVGNAVKFTDEGKIEIGVRLLNEMPDRYRIRFSVQDTGIGIPKELHGKIFEPFFQADSGTTRKYGGTGLGMTIAKEIVNLMGGQIKIDSAPGTGSHFHFDLDLRRVKSRQQIAGPAAVSIVLGKRVLVVDDNATILTLIKELLLRDQHQVTIARSGAEALDLLNAHEFDVIFLDFNMGDMDGAKVLNLYRFGRLQTAPTFFLTADATAATAARLRSIGAAGVLYKPIAVDGLRQAIAQVCSVAAEPQAAGLHGNPPQTAPHPTPLAQPPLATIPTQYIDHDVLTGLASMSERPEFLADVLASAITDIERNSHALMQAIAALDSERVRDTAHALKGVCASIGATRLETIANRLMRTTAEELAQSGARLRTDVVETSRQSVASLRSALPGQAVNG